MRTALAVVVALAVVGCGGSGDGGAEKTTPEQYVSKVCSSVASWQTDLRSTAKDFEDLLGSASASTDLTLMRIQVIRFADGIVADTKRMQRRIRAAGEPDVNDGDEIARALNEAMASLVTALENVSMQAEQLPPNDPSRFYNEAGVLGGAISRSASAGLSGLSAIQAPELSEAAAKDANCRKIS